MPETEPDTTETEQKMTYVGKITRLLVDYKDYKEKKDKEDAANGVKKKINRKDVTDAQLAEYYLAPDAAGLSDPIWMLDFANNRQLSRPKNGAEWNRFDASSYLGRKYIGFNYQWRHLSDEMKQAFTVEFGKVPHLGTIAVHLLGSRKNDTDTTIGKHIRDALLTKNARCVFSGARATEIDHKDGQKDNYGDMKNQVVEHFQPVSRTENVLKRERCKACKRTLKRYDATKLGFGKPQYAGGPDYVDSCVGCYCYDPIKFRREMEKSGSTRRILGHLMLWISFIFNPFTSTPGGGII